jgi:hypothetical protein
MRGLRGGGEALGFALRVGTPIGSKWGIEAEIARPAEIENEGGSDVVPLAYARFPDVVREELGVIYPRISSQVRTSQRYTTLSTTAWARQDLSPRFALVYSGGVGFHRTEQNVEYTYGPVRPVPGLLIVIPPRSRSEAIVYSVRPVVGVDARIGMTAHVELVPSLRLHGLQNGMLIRTGIGLAWTF